MRYHVFLLAAGLALAASSASSLADPGHGPEMPGPGPDHGPHGWHGDMPRLHEHEMNVWRGGRWYHGPHEGRAGWWWIVGGLWYLYTAPIYPYPDPYLPPGVSVPPEPAPEQVWYYCKNPRGYYPYVPACRHWKVVPAQP